MKAEFAADLNNLSNRMAQLENSLDAKIDSLVSSYLTRNGIWNGALQTLVNTESSPVGLYTGSTTFNTYIHAYWLKGGDNRPEDVSLARVSRTSREVLAYDDDENRLIVDNINKSGLMLLNFEINNIVNGATKLTELAGIYRIFTANPSFWGSHRFGELNINFTFKTGSDINNLTDVYFWNNRKRWEVQFYFYQEPVINQFVTFFVNKGEYLYLTSKSGYKTWAQESGDVHKYGVQYDNDGYAVNTSNVQYKCNIKTAYVY